MAYDEDLAARVQALLEGRPGITENRMFGGIAFMASGNMACGVVNNDLMLRLGEEGAQRALRRKHARPMDFTGRTIKTMVFVGPAGTKTAKALGGWIELALEFAQSLPPK